jgi:mono/diheme cytochrome c family protein
MFIAIVPDDVLRHVISEGRVGTPMPAFAQKSGGTLTDAQVQSLVEGIRANWKPNEAPQGPLPDYAMAKSDNPQTRAANHKRGAEVYARACAHCHGENGEGGHDSGPLNDPAFLALISDQALRRIVITGRPDLSMPTYAEQEGRSSDFQPLTSAEIDDVVALLADWRAGRGLATSTEKPEHPTN